ncbi:MerR family transcriptional regulator [Cognatiyoonia sp. IB215182]|uniref:MerR family transcriptional regulator n=1 Tax=Cognatiyoonia sp. IB215182 TaxID=3097353 RepID=UPI002A0CFF59|nr:MerR family transcriptional regulator [Cognatiyoonia sp. IB215182]MDX8353437.1 MerR family transcriptional regulator [Cognatiyoonia sp. IB215182]
MKTRIKEYGVGELARLSGVTVRTLHHYDATGLLRPAHVAANGYRIYGRDELLRLQEILFYRAFGMSLAEIADVLDSESEALVRLRAHRAKLAAQAAKTADLLATLDRTIATLMREADMQDQDLYAPFDAATQTGHEDWLIDTYGPDMAVKIAVSKEAVAAMPNGIAGLMDRLRESEAELVGAFKKGVVAGDRKLVPMLDKHRALMADFWGDACDPNAYAGLADMYLAHSDFVARYERLAPRFSQWLPAAMKAYAAEISA